MNTKLDILLVEDDLLSRLSLKSRLELSHKVTEAEKASDALALLGVRSFDLAFVDLDLETKLAGFEIIKKLKSKNIHTIVLSGREEESIIEEAYLLGCRDFLSKPFTKQAIESVLSKYKNSQSDLLGKLKNTLMTNDPGTEVQLRLIEQAMYGEHPVLITGETGTGKTFLAKYIHELVGSEKPFIHLNCSEISESLIESELFGHEKGAFTGAIKTKKGLMELADGGILFLDEIATLPLNLQKKLLKAIEEKTFYPVGSERPVKSHFRLISATCEDLKTKVKNGDFREDFLFRLEGFNIILKPLRERKNDLGNLVAHFLKQNKRRIVLSAEAKEELFSHSWPGNVRELQKVIEILRSSDKGIIEKADLAGLLIKPSDALKEKIDIAAVKEMGLANFLEKLEAEIVEKVLAENNDRVRKTLGDLKLSNNSFYRIMTNIKTQGGARVQS